MQTKGKLIVFCGPSGAGKSTIAKRIMQHFSQCSFSVSATTRDPREGEEDGVHYHFLSVEHFREKLANDEFLEYEEVYDGLYYGTLRSELESIWEVNRIPVLDLDVKGAANLKARYTEEGLFIFVHPGSIDELAERLRKRATETERSIEKRMRRASFELDYAEKFDLILKNIELENAVKEVIERIEEFIKSGK